MGLEIKGKTPSLKWLGDLLSFFQSKTIKIPTTYRERVLKTKELLESDPSGLVNCLLDFAIECALVEYEIETSNANLTKSLNKWLLSINSKLRNKVPVGLEALAKEYFRERWKGSSFLLLRTFFYNVDGIMLPTTMFFVHGEDIKCKNKTKDKAIRLGDETYKLRISEDARQDIKLPKEDNEEIFVRRPYEAWGIKEPIPFLIRRGIFRNLKFLDILSEKGEYIVGKAIEYLFLMKKGTEDLTMEGNITYSKEDLQKIKDDFVTLLNEKKSSGGTPTYITQFDTDISHVIPDYKRAINAEIYAPIERHILAGLGLVEIVSGVAATRRESILNPAPFVAEIKQAIKDFKLLLNDIIALIIEKNKKNHPKFMGSDIKIYSPPISEFISDKIKAQLRSAYDRGKLSNRTYTEVVAETDYDLEVKRRKDEKEAGHDETMYPPVIQNRESDPRVPDFDDIPDDKKTIEKINYRQALEEAKCSECETIFDFESQEEIETGIVECPECAQHISEIDIFAKIDWLVFVKGYKPEITKNYIRLRQRSPSDFQKKSFRIITLSESKGIKAVIGRLKGQTTTTVQSYLFNKNKWTTKEAQTWVKEHKGTEDLLDKEYEEASYKTIKMGKKLIDMDDIQNLASNLDDEKASQMVNQKSDYISNHLNEVPYKQKITEQTYSYFKLALISKTIKDFQKEDGWKCNDVLNINNHTGERTRPVYSKLPTSRVKTEELLVDGFYCLEKGEDKLVIGIRPYFYNFGVAVYSDNSSKDLADNFINGFENWASENNFLKGEKITPKGKFLAIPETTFNDVKLMEDKKQAIKVGALEFFKKKDVYIKNKLPFKRGLIFAGEPGTGKTLVGKALIKETKNTFIWVTSGDLLTLYGDIDPKSFSRLLEMAKELAPALLFAEDIDDYLESKTAVDTIKTQMDGLDSMEGVVTILCTNYPERIPKSLIDRPSRFDDVIMFELPDETLRYEILDIHLKSTTIKNRNVVLTKIAKDSEGLTGAHLKEVVVYSVLLASDADREEVIDEDFIKALDKIKKTRKLIQTIEEKNREIAQVDYEEAPYTKKSYPPQLKNLPAGARAIWINTFNSVLKQTNNENRARQAAWRNVKLRYKKVGDKWIRKSKGEFEESLEEINIDELIKIKKLEVFAKQEKLLDALIKEEKDDNS